MTQKKILKLIEKSRQAIFKLSVLLNYYIPVKTIQFAGVVILVLTISPEPGYSFDGSKYQEVCSRTLEILHGGFGALLMASAGVGAVVAAAAGGFRLAWSLVVVAVGAFTLKEYQEIWFEPC